MLRDLGSVLLVHAESGEAMATIGEAHGPSYAGYLATRPRGLENLAVAEVIEAARTSRGHAHIVHLSSSDALPMIASARREGVRLTPETCPHYLALTRARIGDGFGADFCMLGPDEWVVVAPKRLQHRHPTTPYAGRRLQGVVRSTILRGEVVDGKRPRGQLLARRAA